MQTRIESLIEAVSNTAIGLLIGTLTNRIVLPMFGHDVSISDSFLMAVVFTLISVTRNYLVRRWYAKS